MTMNATDPGVTITPDLAECGAVSYWKLKGVVDAAALAAAWSDEMLDHALLPVPPSGDTALGRAVHELAGKRRLVRPLAKRGDWVIVDEEIVGTTLTYTNECRTHWDSQRSCPSVTPQNHPLASKILANFTRVQTELSSEDISAWLVRLATKMSAISLRDTGGVYFVPRKGMEFWRSVVRALQAASQHRLFKLPAMKNAEVVEAVIDAVTAEAEAEAAVMEAELAKEGDDALGARALTGRATRCEAVLAKVSTYEVLLGVKLDALRARMETLKADLATAALQNMEVAA